MDNQVVVRPKKLAYGYFLRLKRNQRLPMSNEGYIFRFSDKSHVFRFPVPRIPGTILSTRSLRMERNPKQSLDIYKTKENGRSLSRSPFLLGSCSPLLIFFLPVFYRSATISRLNLDSVPDCILIKYIPLANRFSTVTIWHSPPFTVPSQARCTIWPVEE